MFHSRLLTIHLFLGIVLLLGGCGDSGNLIGPDNQLEVSNVPGTFEWQASALSDVSQTLTYVWANTASTADVNQSSSINGGSATLRVTDDGGTEVYSRSLDETGTFETDSGSAGNWTITVTLSGTTGDVNFRLETP